MSKSDTKELKTKEELGAAAPAKTHTPLATKWSFWYDRKLARGEWTDMKKENPKLTYRDLLKRLGTFDTAEDFWNHYVHLRRPSDLASDVNLYCFREDNTPMWEDFPRGGCWILKVRRSSKGGDPTGRLWQLLLFAAIGEQLGGRHVVGVHVARRSRESLLAVWTRDDADPAARFAVSDRIRSVLQLPDSSVIEYKPHHRSIVDKSGFRNAESYMYVDKTEVDKATRAAQAAQSAMAVALGVPPPESLARQTSPDKPLTADAPAFTPKF